MSTFVSDLYGVNTRVEGFEDITVGWETRIIAFKLLSIGEEPLDLVVRIYSGSDGSRKTEWEFNVMYRLGAASYPVPRVYAYESSGETLGAPFLIMERIMGTVLWDVLFSSPREKYGEVLALNTRLMVQLHDLPPAKVLPGIKRAKTRRRILDRIQKERQELDGYDLKAPFEPLISWLTDSVETLTEYPTCLIHQDLHPRNILLRPDGSPAVIDWGACTLGDFREDLSWTGLLASTFIDESLKWEIYDSYKLASQCLFQDLPYFEAYAGLRRLADAAVSFKAGATARGMRPEAIKEMERNRLHYAKVLKAVTEIIDVKLQEIAQLLAV